jgi:hypothetical protein
MGIFDRFNCNNDEQFTYSRRFFSVAAFAGKGCPSNTKIGLMLWDMSIFINFIQ